MCWAPWECWMCGSTLQNHHCAGLMCECTCVYAFVLEVQQPSFKDTCLVWEIQGLASRAVIQFHIFFQQGDLIWLKPGLAWMASCTSVCTSVIPCHVCEVIFLKHNREWKTVCDSSKWRWREDFQLRCGMDSGQASLVWKLHANFSHTERHIGGVCLSRTQCNNLL